MRNQEVPIGRCGEQRRDTSFHKRTISIMKTLFCCIVLFGCTALTAAAQTAPSASDGSKDPLATYMRSQFRTISGYLIRSAEMMPEENYSMRPGAQMEVRTFGQLLGHTINVNYSLCATAKGEKN